MLEGFVRCTRTEYRLRQRARIVLLAARGMATRAIGREVGCTTVTASKRRVRFAVHRLGGLSETGNRGAASKYTRQTDKRILAQLDERLPAGHGRWSGPLISRALGDVDVQYVWRFLRAQKIDLSGRKSWCQSTDPDFAAKAAEIVGLYLAPPENALVLAVDEKPSIQALERAQGYLKLANGRALTGQSHNYKRHGTTTLFAAFYIATGVVTGRQYKRRRRIEFLDFMNRLVKAHQDREIHVILDDLNTHKPKCDRWLARDKNVHFHSPQLNQRFLAQPSGNLVLHSGEQGSPGGFIPFTGCTQGPHRQLQRKLQQDSPPVRLDKIRSPPKTPQIAFQRPVIPVTRAT